MGEFNLLARPLGKWNAKSEYMTLLDLACLHLPYVSVSEIRHNILMSANLHIPLLKDDHRYLPV